MEKYKSSKNHNELKKMSEKNKSNKKFLAKAAALFVSVPIVSGLAFGYLRDTVTNNDIPKHTSVETLQNDTISNSQFARFKKDNLQDFNMIRNDFMKYKELRIVSSRSDKSETEMNALIEKISSNHKIIEQLAINTVKSKVADAYHLDDYKNLEIKYDMESHSYTLRNLKTNMPILRGNNNDKMQLSETIFQLADLQNYPTDSTLRKVQQTNLLYKLYNSTVKTANSTYIAKNGKLAQVDNMNKKMALDQER